MAKVVVNKRVLMWCHEICGLMSTCEWKCYDLLSILCLVYGDFLVTLGGSSIMGFYLHTALVWLMSYLR